MQSLTDVLVIIPVALRVGLPLTEHLLSVRFFVLANKSRKWLFSFPITEDETEA